MAQLSYIKGCKVESFTTNSASGFQLEGFFCGAANKSNVYFNLELSQKAHSTYLIYNNKTTPIFKQNLDNQPSGIVYVFKNKTPSTVYVKVGISYVSTQNDKENLENEQNGFEFKKIKEAADTEWENELNKIEVNANDNNDLDVFYTALYHSLLMPMT